MTTTKKHRPRTAVYFKKALVIEKDAAILASHLYLEGTEPTITRLFLVKNGKWVTIGDLKDVIHAVARNVRVISPANGRPRMGLLGRRGLYREIDSGQQPRDVEIDIKKAGYLHDLRLIGNHLYACGVQNQVHRQIGDEWHKIDQGTFSPLKGQIDRIFYAIDGFSEEDIYTVGKAGAIWHYDGNVWSQLESPTNVHLYSVYASSSGDLFIGAGGGLIFRGNRSRGWVDISDSNIATGSINSITELDGKIYFASESGLIALEDTRLVKVGPNSEERFPCYHVDAYHGSLWCVGNDNVFQFDGANWIQHICADNVAK